MRSLWTLALVAACGTSSTDTSKDDTDSDTDVTVVDDTGTAECQVAPDPNKPDCSDDVPAGRATLRGTVVDEAGNKIGSGGVRPQFCREVCLVPDCFFDNSFAFGNVEGGPGSFDLVPLCDDERFATPFAPITVTEGETRTIDVVMPRLGAGVALPATAAELEVVDGLYITASLTDITRKSPLDPVPTELAGVDATDITVPIEGIDGTVLAVYYLAPFDYPAPNGLPVRFDDAWDVATEGGELWIGDYETFSWIRVGPLTVDTDGKLTPGGTLPKVSTLVIVRPPPA